MRPAESFAGGLLFVPVSGGAGSGELQRARLLAVGARARWPTLAIAIAAEAQALARILVDTSIERVALPASPTRCTPEVIAAITRLRPAWVVFDSTARVAQLRAARAVGARVVYLSSRPIARARGFRFGVRSLIDQHWSVEWNLRGNPLSLWQHWLARLRPRQQWRHLSTLFEPADASGLDSAVAAFAQAGPYVLACPGGGGGQINGASGGDLYQAAAQHLGALRVLLVRADWPAGTLQIDGSTLQCGVLANAQLMALVAGARLALLGAGSLLPQALALGVPCVAAALMADQKARLHALGAAGAVLPARAEPRDLALKAQQLWESETARLQLTARAHALALRNGLGEALDALAPAIATT